MLLTSLVHLAGKRAVVFAGILLFAEFCVVRYYTRSIQDDAMITYRYAQNLAEGRGFVYNEGERVLGTTTPLYTCIVAVAVSVGFTPWMTSLAMDCLFIGVVLALLAAWLAQTGEKSLLIVSFLLFAYSPGAILPLAGMETGLFMMLSYGALFLTVARMHGPAVWCGALAAVTRPEGSLALLLATGAVLFRPEARGKWLWTLVPPALFLLISGVMLWVYFGSPIPQSVLAKKVQGEMLGAENLYIVHFFRDQWRPFGAFFSLWALLEWSGIALMFLRFRVLWPLAAWFILYLGFMAGGRAPLFGWYATPLYPVRMIALACTGVFLVERALPLLKVRASLRRPLLVVPIVLLLVFAASPGYTVFLFKLHHYAYRQNSPVLACKMYEKAGEWLRENALPQDEIFTPEIGYVGFLSQRRIYDPIGLVTPEALELFATKNLFEHAVLRQSPWVVYSNVPAAFDQIPRSFDLAYRPDVAWTDDVWKTVIYRRRD
jgi:hypothetical protein